jgi:ABC-type lipoprotein export system ATPase subunit
MNEAIKLENVVKMHGNGLRAVNGIRISISQGERVAVYGAPGSGKTTLARLIAGMEPVSSGTVFVLGQAVHEMDETAAARFRNQYIGMLNRDPPFMESLSVLENVALPLAIRGMPLAQREEAAKERLKTMGLQYAAHARPTQLSALEVRIACVVRALITRPQVLLLDDMAAGLSKKDAEHVRSILAGLIQTGDYTILEFAGMKSGLIRADRTVTLDYGMIQEEEQ